DGLRARGGLRHFPAMTLLPGRFTLFVLLLSLLPPLPAWALDAPEEAKQRYQDCMRLARTEPLAGQEMADKWIQEGGGGPAEHCRGVADATLGRYGEAMRRFETLAEGLPDSDQRAQLLGQAGQAAMLDGKLDKAYELQSRAVAL